MNIEKELLRKAESALWSIKEQGYSINQTTKLELKDTLKSIQAYFEDKNNGS